ncbi:RNA polymerase sigma factor [Isoptericola nanjingensis]|uniref:RNA polymerase sigma factor n=1 Tax=Isoptericola TaxID=254250 RepID=UPI003D1B4852|nr:sigma-70 family RNA polymerase sigma factor [Isoptericola sp. QY 916]
MTAPPDIVFSEVFRALYPDVLRFVQRRTDRDVAEDLVAEVFAIAWSRWADVPSEVRPWLFGVARNVVAEDRRSHGRRNRLALRIGAERELPQDAIALATATVDLHVAWSRLCEADREALALVAWDGLTGREAAQVLGCTRAAFSVRLSRARRRLKRLLADIEPEPHADPAPWPGRGANSGVVEGTQP